MNETRTPRKVIQIAVTTSGFGDHLFCLTDDGAVWMLKEIEGALHWQEIPAPPDRLTVTHAPVGRRAQ